MSFQLIIGQWKKSDYIPFSEITADPEVMRFFPGVLAKAALKFAFDVLNETAVYAFTTVENTPSRKVMSKLGMVNMNKDFNHPKLAKGHPLERHCIYKITETAWRESSEVLWEH